VNAAGELPRKVYLGAEIIKGAKRANFPNMKKIAHFVQLCARTIGLPPLFASEE
jgi:hypothetical protein